MIDARVKQAIINSKEQAFKNLNGLNTKVETNKPSEDQVAKSAQVNNDISKESPKQEFLPSPEVSPLYNRENQVQDHFSPMNQYYRPTQQDARFPAESPFSSSKPMLDTRWLGGNKSPNEVLQPSHPFEFMRPPQQYSPPQGRNSHGQDFPFRNKPPPEYYHEDRVTFPSDGPTNSNEIRQSWPVERQVPALNFKQPKGTWKWIPDDETFTKNSTNTFHVSEPETKIQSTGPLLHESYPTYIQRDRPYSFDQPKGLLAHMFGFHNPPPPQTTETHYQRYPTGPSGYPSSGSDTFVVTDEYSNQKNEDYSTPKHEEYSAGPTKLPTSELKHSR